MEDYNILEDTHSTMEETLPEELFDDALDTDGAEDKTESEEEFGKESEQETEDTESSPDSKESETFTLKHLGEEKKVTMEELIALGQKGMDYDFLKRQNEELKQAKELQVIDRLAKESGMSREDYLKRVEITLKESRLTKRMQELMDEGIEEETARNMASLEMDKQELEKKIRELEEPKREEVRRRASLTEDLKELLRLYPDLTELPPDVIEKVEKEGLKPTVAYQAYLLEQKDLKIKQLEQNEKNASKAPGSLRGEGKGELDAFLLGFNS